MRALRGAALLAIGVVSIAATKEPLDIGPAPGWELAKQNAITIIRGELNDPWSARFQFRNGGIVQGKKEWLICGRVNAKNAYGGYVGWQAFSVGVANLKTTKYRMAPTGLGIDACNVTEGFTDEPSA